MDSITPSVSRLPLSPMSKTIGPPFARARVEAHHTDVAGDEGRERLLVGRGLDGKRAVVRVRPAGPVVEGRVGEEQDHRQGVLAETGVAEATARTPEARWHERAAAFAGGDLVEALDL
jgi:hypothetical protein